MKYSTNTGEYSNVVGGIGVSSIYAGNDNYSTGIVTFTGSGVRYTPENNTFTFQGGDSNFIYRGVYNASTNTPTLENGVGNSGDWYLVTVPGTNNPTGKSLSINQVIVYDGTIWQSGGQIDNTDELVISNGYIVIRGQTIQVGQILTVSLGILEGQIIDLATAVTNALNKKQNLVIGAIANNLSSLDMTGQVVDSGISKSIVTTQGNIFNDANTLAKLNDTISLDAVINSGLTQVNGGIGYTGSLNTVLTNIIAAINSGGIGLNGTVFVSKLGSDITGDGSLGKPYLTVTKGMTQAVAGQLVLVDKGTYDEDIIQKSSVALLGTTRLNTIIRSLTINTAGTFDVQNLSLQRSTAGDTLLVSGTGAVNLQARNVSISASGLATNVINWTNSGTGSKGEFIMGIASSGLATIPVWNSTTTSKGTITNFYMTYRNSVNPDADCLLLNGAMAFNHTFDGTQGRVVVSNTSSYIGTLLTMVTGTVAALTTNSSAISSLNLVSVTTSKINVVDGAGGFAMGIVGFLGTGYGFANTLNGGAGAIVGEQSPIRFDQSPLLPTIQAGLVQSDGTNLYYDNTVRNKVAFNPMTDAGDIIIGGPAGSPDKLAVAGVGKVLTVNPTGLPSWQNTATPTQVATAVDTGGVANKNYFRVTYPGGATFTTSTASTGAMRISLPLLAKSNAFDIRMNVSIISTSGTFLSAASTLEISAYWAIGTGWLFTNATLTSALAQDLVVTFGQRSDNASPCIYLGKTTNTWDTGTRISVDNVEAGRFGATAGVLQDDWSIDVVTTINVANELESLVAPVATNNCLTAASELAGYDSAGNLILQLNNTGGILPGIVTAQTAAKGVQTGQLATLKSMFDNGINYLSSKYRYVDNVGGLDTNNGSYNAPYKTMKYSVENNPTGTIHVLMGQSAEAAFSIPADKTNIDIIAQGTRSALNGFTNKVTVLTTGYGSVRFQGLNFGGGLTRAATCTCGIYVYDGSIGSAGFTNSGNGYTEISQTDASNGVNNISAGTTVFYGGKVSAPSMTGTGTVVTFDNVGTVNGNAAIAAAGVTLYMFETNWAAAASGHAISCVAGTVVTIQGCNFVRPNGTLASIKVDNYDIQNTDFDRANSVLGTHIGNYDWYAKLGLLNADTITTATKMLVRKPTGEIAEQLISGGSTQRSSLYLAGYGAASPVQNGNLDFSDSSSVSSVGTGITYAGVNISLEAGKNYTVTTMLNSVQAGVPDASRKIISYSGATTSGNNFAFDNTNMTATNGSITNNVYVTAVALPVGTNGAVAPTVAYDTNGSINLLIPSAAISPYQCVLYSDSTANNWSIYGQAAYSANALLTLNAGALTVAAVNRVDTQGGTFGSGELEFTHPYTGVNPTEYAACAGYGVSVVSDSLSSTRFAYKKGGDAFVLQATAFANSVVMNGSLTACYSPTLDVAVFVGTSAVSAQINLTTGAFVQTTFGTQGCVQVNRGLLTGVETFVGVGSTTNPLTIRKSTDGSTWTALANNNLTAILPTTGTTGTPVYSIGGICQTLDGENAWLVAVNDTVNNICHICTSSGLLIFQKIKSYYGFNVTGLLALQFGGTTGTSNVGGSSAIVGASSNTTGAGNIVIYNKGYYGTESSWLTITNPTITSTQAIRLGVSPSGMIYVWNAQNGTAVAYSNNGGSSYTTTTLGTAFTYLMPYADFKIISGSTTSASRQYNASYRWNYSGGTYIPKAVWLNSQKLQAGVNSSTSIVFTDIIPNSYVVNLDGTITMTGAPLSIVGNNNRYFKVGVSSLNSYEKVSYLSGSVFAVSNTFLYKITGTNCTVATTTQAPGLQGNVQTSVQAQVTNVATGATIQLNSSYNSGTNTLGGGNSILVQEI